MSKKKKRKQEFDESVLINPNWYMDEMIMKYAKFWKSIYQEELRGLKRIAKRKESVGIG
jgi:hypothetical protein